MLKTITFSSVQVRASECAPRVHTDHNDGTYSVALTPSGDPCSIYAMGTPEELYALSDLLCVAAREAMLRRDMSDRAAARS